MAKSNTILLVALCFGVVAQKIPTCFDDIVPSIIETHLRDE
ncbi:MAG: hypothetical protein RSC43_02255 [Clostridia bacterium]